MITYYIGSGGIRTAQSSHPDRTSPNYLINKYRFHHPSSTGYIYVLFIRPDYMTCFVWYSGVICVICCHLTFLTTCARPDSYIHSTCTDNFPLRIYTRVYVLHIYAILNSFPCLTILHQHKHSHCDRNPNLYNDMNIASNILLVWRLFTRCMRIRVCTLYHSHTNRSVYTKNAFFYSKLIIAKCISWI